MAETSTSPLYENLKVRRNKNSEAEIECEISVAVMQQHADRVFEDMRRELTLPGFRKGQVPPDMARRQMNEMHMWEDAADRALRAALPALIETEKLSVIGHPEVHITKMAPGNPLGLKIRLALEPEFELPDYKKIGTTVMAEEKPATVTDAEVDETIRQLQLMRAKTAPGAPAPKEQSLPELTDEEVKKYGPFENVAAFRTKLRENMIEEKQAEAHREKREAIALALIEKTKMTLPEMILQMEADAMREERGRQVESMKLSMEDYLKQVKKTEEQIAKEEREYAERQLKTRFIFEKIATIEKFTAEPEAIEWNVKLLAQRYPDAEPENLERYVATMMVNQQVLDLLEGKKSESESESKPGSEPKPKVPSAAEPVILSKLAADAAKPEEKDEEVPKK